jgi:hypothetical protein
MNAVSTTNLSCRLRQTGARYIVVALRLAAIVTAILLLAAIVYCALAPSSHMREVWFIPTWLGVWADQNPNFRNFPAFAALAALLFLALRSMRSHLPALSRLGWFDLALFAAVVAGVIGVALELLQPEFRLRSREASFEDISWSVAGAFAGALGGVLASKMLARPRSATSHS